MATFIKRPSGWLAQVRLKGTEPQFQTFPTKAQAVIWAGQVEAEIRSKKSSKYKPIAKTLYDALTKYKEEVTPTKKGKRWEEIRINKLLKELDFVGKLIGDVDATDISSWRDARLGIIESKLTVVKSSSVNREMNILSNVFTTAVREWKWCTHNPVRETKRPKSPKHRDRLTTDEERQEMLDKLGYVEGNKPETVGARVGYAYLIALETAMRASEICSLNKKTIHIKKQYVHLPDSKNDKARDVSLSTRAIYLLSFFPDGLGLNSRQIDAMWRKARSKTKGKVDNLHFHDSCHQAITNLARKLNVLELSRMTGRSIKTLMIYFNESASTIADKLD